MCGITGIFHFDKLRHIDLDRLKKMTDILHHRGPDDEGYYVNKNVGLGHRRLSIIDLHNGKQPMYNNSKTITLVFNGEIYNYIELREELVMLGHQFKTNSDSEVIIKSYEQWGINCQNKFNGMWAFALWDESIKQLFLSRDRIGEKPLHYCIFENTLIFASEIKSIFEFGVPRIIRTELIEVYLAMTNIPSPDTFFKDIFKLKPGHYIIAGTGKINEYKYWDLPEIDEQNMLADESKIYDRFSYLLEDSVRIRMRSDVPYGAFLSGGLDSSSIVALMAGQANHPVESFTIGFPEKEFDETYLALKVARRFGTNHHQGTVEPSSIGEFLKKLIFHFDEPFGDSSAIPTWQVSSFATKKVKMVLTGDGGDEVLSGYNSYTGIKISSLVSGFPLLLQNMAVTALRGMAQPIHGGLRYKINKIQNIIETASLPFAQRMLTKGCYIPLPLILKLTENIKNKISVQEYFEDVTRKIPYQNDFYKLMYLNFKHDLPDDYLVKVDRMSMANSLETRTPFLDYRLIEFMASVDKRVKHQGWERKSVLRRSVGRKLPNSLLKAPKRGFGVPLREWLKDDMGFQNIKLQNVCEICDHNVVKEIVEDNAMGKRNNGNFIWMLMMLDEALR
ncbi:MAG: asparagine synthase (glutamine-hydrolyzing) [Bacteroidetes bacterium]|nr:asparagine synthase (glutamine-hydrolyzing) [Bacteroidota bacterium]